jgi:hypothetical protein
METPSLVLATGAHAQRVRLVALQMREDLRTYERRVALAYQWLAAQPNGQVLLDDWCRILLEPALTPEDEGARRFVQKVLQIIREHGPAVLEDDDDGGP